MRVDGLRIRWLLLAGLLLAPLACSRDNDILLTIRNLPMRTASLSLSSTLNGTSGLPAMVTAPLDRVGVHIPADKAGRLELILLALDSDGCIQATGNLGTDLPTGRTDRELSLTAQSPRRCGALSPCAADTICKFPRVVNVGLKGIWANSPSDVWAVGDESIALHYDGMTWQKSSIPDDNGGVPKTDLKAVWASGPSDVWAVGTLGRAFHYDGQGFRQTPTNVQAVSNLNAVWGLHENDVWAVGGDPTKVNTQDVVHWTGQSWQSVNTGLLGNLFGVWAGAPNHVYACGTVAQPSQKGQLIHFNGQKWEGIDPQTSSELHAIWGTLENRIFMVGVSGAIVYRDETSQVIGHDSMGTTTAFLRGVFGNENAVYTVGSNAGSFNLIRGTKSPSGDTFLFKSVDTNASENLNSVFVGKNGIGWVSGDNGFLGYFDTRP